MKSIVIIAGTRPEVIKLFPVYAELKKIRTLKVRWVSTGQHKEMLSPLYELFSFIPDVDLGVMTSNQDLSSLTSMVLRKCSEYFQEINPDCVIVQGDTSSAMAASMAAFYQQIPVAHVEAGLRSYNINSPFPEEVNRRIISAIATLNFAPTELSAKALIKEKLTGRILISGNTVIDTLFLTRKKVMKKVKNYYELFDKQLTGYEGMVLITGHRRENYIVDGFYTICNAVRRLAENFPNYSFVYPVHLNPNVQKIVYGILSETPNIFLIDPVPYDQMVFLMMSCKFILTDSGGVQEEAPSLGKPVLIMRTTTERPEGVKEGCAKLVGVNEESIYKHAVKLLNNSFVYVSMSTKRNPYGGGKSAKFITLHIKDYLNE